VVILSEAKDLLLANAFAPIRAKSVCQKQILRRFAPQDDY
jgi:hypothetical protein